MHPVDGDHLRQPVWLAIRAVLMEEWDPIGVADWDCAADEYAGYIPKIKALLRAGASVEEMIDYLDWVGSQRMGFSSQRERCRNAAQHLMPFAAMLEPL